MNERLQESSEALVEMQTNHVLNQTRAAATTRQCDEAWAKDFDGEHCLDCGIEIPQIRINYGMVRCTTCQVRAERKSKKLPLEEKR